MKAGQIIGIIDEHGVPALAGFDGCVCGQFEIAHVRVNIDCHKRGVERGITVSFPNDDMTTEELLDIALAVQDDLMSKTCFDEWPILFAGVEDGNHYRKASKDREPPHCATCDCGPRCTHAWSGHDSILGAVCIHCGAREKK